MTVELSGIVSNLLLSVYCAGREESIDCFQTTVFDLLCKAVRFDSGRWVIGTMDRGGYRPHSEYLYREPEEMVGAYAEFKAQDNMAKAVAATRRGTFSATASVFFSAKSKAGIRGYTQRFEHRNLLLSAITDDDTRVTQWLAFYRATEKDTYGARDRNLVSQLQPHVREAMAINQHCHLQRIASGDRVGLACAVADPVGLLHQAEPEFMALLHEECAGGGKRLPAEALDALKSAGRYIGRRIVIEARRGGGMIFLKARLREPADSLSPRELQIARLVSQALTYRQIAECLYLSPTTVRTHIQHIHAKLETHSTVELSNRIERIRS